MAKYVGKRIVPLPCGEWDQRKEYEMLSVVLEPSSGDSYIARRQVPAGTAITDTSFWAKSSEYSQQLQNVSDQLTETLRAVKADNDTTEAAIKADNDATEQTIAQDNADTRSHVDQVTDDALTEMNLAKQSFNTTSAALTARMDSIVGGATTDTEILDARVDTDNVAHENLGEHIRAVTKRVITNYDALCNVLATAEGVEAEACEYGYTECAVIEKTGAITVAQTLTASYRVSDAVEVEPGGIYSITASGYYNKMLYAFYDEDDHLLAGQLETTTVAPVKIYDKLVVAPVNAAKLRIAWIEGATFVGKIAVVNKLIFPTDRLTGELLEDYEYLNEKAQAAFDHAAEELISDDFSYTEENVEFEVISSKVLPASTGVPTDLVRPSDNYKVSEMISVTPMEPLHIIACSHYNNCVYVFYDADEKMIDKLVSEGGAPVTEFDGKVVTPLRAAYLRISYMPTTLTGYVKRITRSGFVGDFSGTFEGEIDGDVTGNITGTLTGEFFKWTGKKWAVVGDSHTEHNIRATKNYHDYVAEKTGITVVNLGSSGSGYKRRWEDDKAFYQLLDRIPEDTDVVTLYGSGNDLATDLGEVTDTGTDTLCGCINTTIDRYNELFPGKPLGIVTPCPWASSNPSNPNNKMALYSDAIVEICKRRSIPCLDLYHCSNLRPWEATFRELFYTRDDGGGCHPDENGHAILAPRFAAFLETLLL